MIDEDLVEQQPAGVNDVRLLRLEGSPAATQYGAKGTTCPGEAEGLRPKLLARLDTGADGKVVVLARMRGNGGRIGSQGLCEEAEEA